MDGSSQNGPGGVNGSNGMSRADRFEDEKRRIIDSCFGKKDEDGSLLESYITHIRVIEDGTYPSSPPPPNANPDAKKPRLIIVAVRKSGRVRMHKARENVNGTFSIGKTWMLDDLAAVESFSGPAATTSDGELRKQWAGGSGFIVTIGKPYYWQANTPKEKQFFIASLVKIYTKYTGGKSPELLGFDAKEQEQLGVAPPARPLLTSQPPPAAGPPFSQTQNRAPGREPSREPSWEPSRDPTLRSQPSRDAMQRMPPSASSSLTSQTSRPQLRSRREESPSDSIDSNAPPPQQSLANLRRLGGSNQSQESFARTDDNASLPPRSRGGLNGMPSAAGRFQDRSITPNSQRAGTPDSSLSGSKDASDDIPPVPAPLAVPPERRRPPMPVPGDPIRSRNQNSNENMVPAPLASPGMRREDLRPPTRSGERNQPRDREPEINSGTNRAPNMNGSIMVGPSEGLEGAAKNETTPVSAGTPASASNQPSVTAPAVKMPPEPEEEVRPGLGPMIKKKSKGDIANTFLKAAKTANAFNSFKPRAGGAADRLREAQAKQAQGPDGITSVVPAPSLVKNMVKSLSNDSSSLPVLSKTSSEKIPTRRTNDIPEVKITVPQSNRPSSIEGPLKTPQGGILPEKSKAREIRRPKPASEIMQKELAFLGIDVGIIDGKGAELVNTWDDFGWVGENVHTKNIEQMKEEVERELNKVQAGGWLNRFEEEDERVEAIKTGLDKCMDECDELDGLLTLYLVELSTLNEDIAYIEAQSQGLQVQTANQKLLQVEVQSLLDTISISSSQLNSLRDASLETPSGIEQIEKSLVLLFKGMVTIDPSLGASGHRPIENGIAGSAKPLGFGDSEIGSMRVLQEKKDVYRNESITFLRRLKPFMQVKFGAAVDETRKALEAEKGNNLARVAGRAKLDPRNHDLARITLWRYSPLMLFARNVDRPEWEELMKIYDMVCRPLYQEEFRDAVFAWKRIARKPTGDEADLLFTSQVDKQTEGIASTARKLTVKRSQTLAKSLRSPIGDNSSKTTIDKSSDGRLQWFEVFGGTLDEMVPIISMEQNFIAEFFHVTSLEEQDFADAVASAAPDLRRGSDLRRPRVMDPDRDLARLVVQTMEGVFPFVLGDLQALVDWALQNDPLQGVGVTVAIERKLADLEESSQEFLSRTLQKVHTRLVGLFGKFLDDQIRAIEETKVKIKKRKGVIGFIRIFPSFSLSLETMLVAADDLEIRETANQAYARINKTMFESLKVIARENPGAQAAGTDPEDKEALNYEILLIENMNHYLEEVDSRSNRVLEEWKQKAGQEMEEHLSLYLRAVIQRPLGKLLDFLESTESLMLSRQPGEPSTKISGLPSHSKATFKKVLAGYDSKEIRRGIETLKKRVEKHFGDADDPGLSRGLVTKVLQSCERFYEKVDDRILTISRDVYDADVIAEWSRADISAAFKK